jgi:hypothetical protein
MVKRPDHRNKPRTEGVRLAGSNIVPKGFKPYVVRNPKTEQDVVDFLVAAAEAGDNDAELLLGLLKVMSLNDLIVEGAIRLRKD